MNRGFTLLEIIIVIVILGILGAMLVPAYQDLTSESHSQTAKSVAAALTTSSANNYRFESMGSSKAVAVGNCTDVPNTLKSDAGSLPAGYVITSQTIPAGQKRTCTLTAPDGTTTETFVGVGVS